MKYRYRSEAAAVLKKQQAILDEIRAWLDFTVKVEAALGRTLSTQGDDGYQPTGEELRCGPQLEEDFSKEAQGLAKAAVYQGKLEKALGLTFRVFLNADSAKAVQSQVFKVGTMSVRAVIAVRSWRGATSLSVTFDV